MEIRTFAHRIKNGDEGEYMVSHTWSADARRHTSTDEARHHLTPGDSSDEGKRLAGLLTVL